MGRESRTWCVERLGAVRRVLVIDFTYTKPDGTEGRYRRDAAVQTTAAAQTEDAARRMGGDAPLATPRSCAGRTGNRIKPVSQAPEPETPKEPTFGETFERYFTEYGPCGVRTLHALRLSREDHHAGLAHVPRSARVRGVRRCALAQARRGDGSRAGSRRGTRRHTFNALRSVARFAVEVKIPPPRAGVPAAPSVVEAGADRAPAVRCRSGHRRGALPGAPGSCSLLAAHAGLRKGEICGLRCCDCELELNRLVVAGGALEGAHRHAQVGTRTRGAADAANCERPCSRRGVDKRPRGECAALVDAGQALGLHRALPRLPEHAAAPEPAPRTAARAAGVSS